MLKIYISWFLVFFGVLFPYIANSQNFFILRGFVFNESNEAISSATIRVVNENAGTTTDKNGKYEIRLLEGLNRLSVSSIGYKTEIFEVVIAKDVVKNIFLKIDEKLLNEVVVKTKKRDYAYEVIKNVVDMLVDCSNILIKQLRHLLL